MPLATFVQLALRVLRAIFGATRLLGLFGGLLCILTMAPSDGRTCSMTDHDRNRQFDAIAQAQSAHELADLFDSLFQQADTDEVRGLTANTHDGIALRAHWQQVRAALGRERRTRAVALERTGLWRFAGFAEGRLRTLIPEWWLRTLLSAEAYHQGNIFFPGVYKEVHYIDIGCGFLGRSDTSIEQCARGIVLRVGDGSVVIPHRTFSTLVLPERDERGRRRFGSLLETDACYVALHSERCNSYVLRRLDPKTGECRWTADVWAAGDLVRYVGMGEHSIAITQAKGRILIFGGADDAMYVEAFDPESGKNLFRFSTAY